MALFRSVLLGLFVLSSVTAEGELVLVRERESVSIWCSNSAKTNEYYPKNESERPQILWKRTLDIAERAVTVARGDALLHRASPTGATYGLGKHSRLRINEIRLNDTGSYSCELTDPTTGSRSIYTTFIKVNPDYRIDGELWPNRTVPYLFHAHVLKDHRKIFLEAFTYIMQRTCLKFEHYDERMHVGVRPLTIIVDMTPTAREF